MPEPMARLDEIRALMAHLPGPDLDAGSAATSRERQLTKPAGALGRLEELVSGLPPGRGATRRVSTIPGLSCSRPITASRRAASRPIPRR